MGNYVDEITNRGFVIVADVIDTDDAANILRALANAKIDQGESQRAGKAFGIRNLG